MSSILGKCSLCSPTTSSSTRINYKAVNKNKSNWAKGVNTLESSPYSSFVFTRLQLITDNLPAICKLHVLTGASTPNLISPGG